MVLAAELTKLYIDICTQVVETVLTYTKQVTQDLCNTYDSQEMFCMEFKIPYRNGSYTCWSTTGQLNYLRIEQNSGLRSWIP